MQQLPRQPGLILGPEQAVRHLSNKIVAIGNPQLDIAMALAKGRPRQHDERGLGPGCTGWNAERAGAERKLGVLAADQFQLKDRGRLAPGAFADIVVFDPEAVGDRATFAVPRQYAVGITHVVVNGRPTLRDGAFTEARGGCFLG